MNPGNRDPKLTERKVNVKRKFQKTTRNIYGKN